jgi:hypothetical protein
MAAQEKLTQIPIQRIAAPLAVTDHTKVDG